MSEEQKDGGVAGAADKPESAPATAQAPERAVGTPRRLAACGNCRPASACISAIMPALVGVRSVPSNAARLLARACTAWAERKEPHLATSFWSTLKWIHLAGLTASRQTCCGGPNNHRARER